jgi:two-component system sensor histidine kinase HydH
MMTIEFEPRVAQSLVAEATRTLLLSGLVAGTLVAAAIFLWRLSLRQDQYERKLEQQRRLSALGEMSAVLAHEIRNPLASLKGHAQLLAERLPPDGPDRDKAALVVREAQRLEALTTDLLDFARSGPIDLQGADPVALLRASAAEVGDGIVVRQAGAPTSWPLDERRVRQALTNVLRNSRQESPEGRDTEATAGLDDGALVFTVRDFGPGIPAGQADKIFTPFYTTRTNGTGLGLAVARRIAELHGGTIEAHNHPGGGAVFTMRFPRVGSA